MFLERVAARALRRYAILGVDFHRFVPNSVLEVLAILYGLRRGLTEEELYSQLEARYNQIEETWDASPLSAHTILEGIDSGLPMPAQVAIRSKRRDLAEAYCLEHGLSFVEMELFCDELISRFSLRWRSGPFLDVIGAHENGSS